ncbi:MAG: hypothetical protein DSY82_04025 [Flavobacteriia bacterium]|nr:MAG: hypothetical protein DSY82_04025 [Flavobacteriia bacterium]
MKLEQKILEYLKDHDDGRFMDVSLIDNNYELVKEAVSILKGKNLIVVENTKPRNLEFFGIPNNRISRIKVKINSNGKAFLFGLRNKKNGVNMEQNKKSFWKMAYFFG